jgi:hypothetical protein
MRLCSPIGRGLCGPIPPPPRRHLPSYRTPSQLVRLASGLAAAGVRASEAPGLLEALLEALVPLLQAGREGPPGRALGSPRRWARSGAP